MNIRQKLVILLLLIALIPTLLVSSIAYITISKQLNNSTNQQLSSSAIKQEQRVNVILRRKQEWVIRLVEQYSLVNSIDQYSQKKTTENAAAITKVLEDSRLGNSEIQHITLTDLSGQVIASTNKDVVGKQLPQDMYTLKSGLPTTIRILEDPDDKINKLYIASEVSVNLKKAAIVIFTYPIDDISAAVEDYTGLGKTGETVIAEKDNQGNIVSVFPLRFKQDAAFATSLASLNLLQPVSKIYPDLVDYRGKHVIAATRYIDFVDWGLGVKIDQDEAFAPIVALSNILIIIAITSVVAIFFIALYIARYFTAPIIALTHKTHLITQGDLNQQIAVNSKDEIGQLSTAFNQMTTNLKQKIEQLHDERIKLEASINSLSLGYIMVDRENNIVTINHAARQALCASSSSILATVAECTLIHIEDELKGAFDMKALLERCFNEKRALMLREVTYNNKFFKIVVTPIITIGVIGAVVLIDDITEAKILERSKDEFFSIASHELRTPLTAIKGNASLIEQFYSEKLKEPELAEMIADIHESSNRLIGIVNDFLDMSRLEQGKMVFNKVPVDLTSLINSVIKEYVTTGSQRKIGIEYHPQTTNVLFPKVYADPNKTRQVLVNLIGNALKFTEQGKVIISTQLLPGFVKIFVTDTGRGISLANQNLLFRKFQQAGASLLTRDTTKGTGLGLYISKLIAQGLGGGVKLESSVEGKGTTFSFSLPIASQEQLMSNKPQVSSIRVDEATGLTKQNPTIVTPIQVTQPPVTSSIQKHQN